MTEKWLEYLYSEFSDFLLFFFQKQTSDLYIDDITCEIDCKIQHVSCFCITIL